MQVRLSSSIRIVIPALAALLGCSSPALAPPLAQEGPAKKEELAPKALAEAGPVTKALTEAGPVKGGAEKTAIPTPDPVGSKIPLGPRIEPTRVTPSEGPPAPTNHPQAVAIINRYLDSLGGLKVLEAIQDRVTRFRVVKHAATGETVAAMSLFLKRDHKIREEWEIEKIQIKDQPLAFIQVFNGIEGWVQMFGTVSPLEGRTLSLFVWDKLLDDSFGHWEEDGYSVDYVGAGSVDKEPCEIIETTDFSGANKARYFFSKETGLLLKREWSEQGQNGLAKKETFYKKYRKLPFSDTSGKGVQFALLHEIYEDGDLDTTREYAEVKFNSGIKDDIFERPAGVEFKGVIGGGEPAQSPGTERPPAHPPIGASPLGGHPLIGGHSPPPVQKSAPPVSKKDAPPPVQPEKKPDAKP